MWPRAKEIKLYEQLKLEIHQVESEFYLEVHGTRGAVEGNDIVKRKSPEATEAVDHIGVE